MRERKRRSWDRARRSGGFSLIEVVISMAILSFGMLTLALLQIYALKQGSAARHTGDAAAVARTYVEQAHRVPWSVLTGAVAGGWQAPSWNGAPATMSTTVANPDGGTNTERTYTVLWQVTDVGVGGCLRDVEIRVTWAEEDVPGGKQLDMATRRYNWGGASC